MFAMSIYVVLCSIIIALGSICNVISIVIWKYGKRSKETNCKTYMWSLALNDLFILSVLGTEYVFLISGIDLQIKHDIICKCIVFFGLFSPQVSSWITVIIAVERMLYVCIPIKMYKTNVKRRSLIAITCILVFSFFLNTESLFSVSIIRYYHENDETFLNCAPDYDDGTAVLLMTISYGIFTFILPLLLITSSNVITLVSMCTGSKILPQSSYQRRNIRNISKLVTAISCMHCISTFPYTLYLYGIYTRSSVVFNYDLGQITFICYFLNSGLNFVLYCIFGEGFRQDLKEITMGLLKSCEPINNWFNRTGRSTMNR